MVVDEVRLVSSRLVSSLRTIEASKLHSKPKAKREAGGASSRPRRAVVQASKRDLPCLLAATDLEDALAAAHVARPPAKTHVPPRHDTGRCIRVSGSEQQDETSTVPDGLPATSTQSRGCSRRFNAAAIRLMTVSTHRSCAHCYIPGGDDTHSSKKLKAPRCESVSTSTSISASAHSQRRKPPNPRRGK